MKTKIFGLFLLLVLITTKSYTQDKKDFVPYNVIVTQGNYRAISISKENRTRERLLLLGGELEEQNKNTYQIYILVFDDEKAAKLYSKVDYLTASEDKFYADHYIATYWKSPSARHDFTIMLDGMNGSFETIDYKNLSKTTDFEKVGEEENLTEKKPYEPTASDGIISMIPVAWLVILILLIIIWKRCRYNVWFEFCVAFFMGFLESKNFVKRK